MGRGGDPHFSRNVETFIEEWRKTVSPKYENPNVLRIHFEDLIYNYDQTIRSIENFLGITHKAHVSPKKFFIPEKSLNNTQVFNIKSQWKEVAEKIAKELPEYIYEFPYIHCPEKKEIFA